MSEKSALFSLTISRETVWGLESRKAGKRVRAAALLVPVPARMGLLAPVVRV